MYTAFPQGGAANAAPDAVEFMSAVSIVIGAVLEALTDTIVGWWLGCFEEERWGREEMEELQRAAQHVIRCNIWCIRMSMDEASELARLLSLQVNSFGGCCVSAARVCFKMFHMLTW